MKFKAQSEIILFRTIPVEVWFNERVRKSPPCGTSYRPHFVIKGTNDYLGIQFENLEQVPLSEHTIERVQLTGEDYYAKSNNKK